jgi:pilus assembly protein CpaF
MSLRDRLRRKSSTPQTDVVSGEHPVVDEGGVATQAEAASDVESVGSFLPTTESFRTPAETAAHHAPVTDELSTIEQLKVDVHRRLIERLDLEALEEIKDETQLTAQIREAVIEFLRGEATPLSQSEREEIVEQIVYEITGLGPLEPLFRDPTISDILVNGARDIYVERKGRLMPVNAQFRNDAHLIAVIDRIVSRVGRRVDESSPMVDARLPDGSRVNAIIPPLALDGPVLSIRRFGNKLGMDELVAAGTITRQMAILLAGCVHARLNILISGGTGSGKTTLLNALSSFVPTYERIVTIEDAAELRLQQEHVVRLETRPPNVEGRGEVVARDLVRNALRMRPDRIIIGEVRSAEVIDMLQAMNTGHEGSLATIHANTPRDALSRLETMILLSGTSLPVRAMREQIASAIDVIVQVARMADGSRRVVSIAEVAGMDGDIVTTSEIFEFKRRGLVNNKVVGTFTPTGVRPRFMERITISGITLPPGVFDETVDVTAEGAADTTAAESKPFAPNVPEIDVAARRRMVELEHRLAVLEREGQRGAERQRGMSMAMLAFIEALDEAGDVAHATKNESIERSMSALNKRAQWFIDAFGLSPIEPKKGDKFDDALHEIVSTAAPNGVPKGRIVQVTQRGFRADGRIARRAQVVIAG